MYHEANGYIDGWKRRIQTWAFTAKIERMLLAFESKCYRRFTRVKWAQKITTDTIFSRIDRKEKILQKAIRRKMSLFGHVANIGDERNLKTVMFGVMEGKNKRGRPHREWVDDIEDWSEDTIWHRIGTAGDGESS